MQVFIPYPDFQESVHCLDRARLGKQRIECEQILATLRSLRVHESGPGVARGWVNHPAVKMWRGSESALAVYLTMCDAEWRARGYNSTRVTPYDPETFLLRAGFADSGYAQDGRDATLPVWWGRDDVHASHRAALLYKDFHHYIQFHWSEPPELAYVWPGVNDDI